MHVLINRPGIHRIDRRIDVRKRGRQDPDDFRPQLPRSLQELHPLLPRHPLVRHQDRDFIFVLRQQRVTILRIRCRKNPVLILERARKIFQRLLFVIHVKNRVLFIIVKTLHRPT